MSVLASLAAVLVLGIQPQDRAADPVGDALISCAPATLDAAMNCLDAHWTSRGEFEALSYDDVSLAHFGIGMWMRNNWGLWRGGTLASYFNGIGIQHPDDMSGIILKSYWLHLHECPLRLEEQVAGYKAYWERAEGGVFEPIETNLDCTVQQGANAR